MGENALRRRLYKWVRRSSIKKQDLKPHDPRRTSGTWFLQTNPGHVRELAEKMGHSDLSGYEVRSPTSSAPEQGGEAVGHRSKAPNTTGRGAAKSRTGLSRGRRQSGTIRGCIGSAHYFGELFSVPATG